LNTLLTNDEFIPHLLDLLLLRVVAGTFLASDLMLAPVLFGLICYVGVIARTDVSSTILCKLMIDEMAHEFAKLKEVCDPE
jgi:hypothetical protein